MVILKTSQRLEELKNVVVTRIGAASEFARDNPIVTGGALGTVGLLSAIQVARVIGRRKKRKVTKKIRLTKRKTSRVKSRRPHKRSKKPIKRGRGLGRKEIHHGHKGSKLVSFRTAGGKLVRFKVKAKQKKHLGKRRIKSRSKR